MSMESILVVNIARTDDFYSSARETEKKEDQCISFYTVFSSV